MTDAALQGTLWPALNPDYTADPNQVFEELPAPKHFNARHYNDLTPEFLLEECITRKWKSIHGRVQSYEETEGGWNITCRLGKDQDFLEYFVPQSTEDFPDLT